MQKLKQLESLAKEAPALKTRVAQLEDEVGKLREAQAEETQKELQQQKFPEIQSGLPDKAELAANLGFQQAAFRIDAAEMAKDQVLSLAKPEPAKGVPSTPKRMPKPRDDSRSPDSLASTCLPEDKLEKVPRLQCQSRPSLASTTVRDETDDETAETDTLSAEDGVQGQPVPEDLERMKSATEEETRISAEALIELEDAMEEIAMLKEQLDVKQQKLFVLEELLELERMKSPTEEEKRTSAEASIGLEEIAMLKEQLDAAKKPLVQGFYQELEVTENGHGSADELAFCALPSEFSFPFFQYLSVKDLCALRASCKRMSAPQVLVDHFAYLVNSSRPEVYAAMAEAVKATNRKPNFGELPEEMQVRVRGLVACFFQGHLESWWQINPSLIKQILAGLRAHSNKCSKVRTLLCQCAGKLYVVADKHSQHDLARDLLSLLHSANSD